MTEATTFADLGLADEIVAALSGEGSHPRSPSDLTIPDALAGRDVCGKAKTGSGKTLAFGLPVLQRMDRAEANRPTGLVLVPTRELANQVCDELAPAAAAVGWSCSRSMAAHRSRSRSRSLTRALILSSRPRAG